MAPTNLALITGFPGAHQSMARSLLLLRHSANGKLETKLSNSIFMSRCNYGSDVGFDGLRIMPIDRYTLSVAPGAVVSKRADEQAMATSRIAAAHVHAHGAATFLLLSALLLSGCGKFLEDNGTHLAYAIEEAAAKLRASADHETIVHYTTLDGVNDPYYVEITPSFPDGRTTNVPGSYLVVSGTTPGGTSYHNRFVVVPQRLYIKKDQGGATDVVLQKDGRQVAVVALR
jgi:hypothetical protein